MGDRSTAGKIRTKFVCALPHIDHIGVRAESWAWSKENLLNLHIARVPQAKYISWHDAELRCIT